MTAFRPPSYGWCLPRRAACALGLVLWIAAVGCGDDSIEIDKDVRRDTLAKFRFEGLPLAASVADFETAFPTAVRDDDDRVDAQNGLVGYTVAHPKSADSARFLFYRGKLYQIEIQYDAKRIAAQGGFEAILRKLIAEFGVPDNAFGNRRTWHQATIARRADFYTSRNGGQLIVTDTSVTSIVERHQKRTALEEDVRLGF